MFLARHLIKALFLSRSSEMVIFSAYFDASGDRGTRVTSFAGFVSRATKWDRFQCEWLEILKVNPRVRMFHMSDFVSSQNGWEEWRGPASSNRRAELIANLVACIKRNTNKGFSSAIRKSDFDKANEKYLLHEELGDRYVLSGLACLGALKLWAARKALDYKDVLIVLEEGDEEQYRLLQYLRSEGFNAIPQSKDKVRAFDACDLAAWKAESH